MNTEILKRASEILGSQEAAQRWMSTPAMGLAQQRPIELLSTPEGVALVEELLGRMKYCVYV